MQSKKQQKKSTSKGKKLRKKREVVRSKCKRNASASVKGSSLKASTSNSDEAMQVLPSAKEKVANATALNGDSCLDAPPPFVPPPAGDPGNEPVHPAHPIISRAMLDYVCEQISIGKTLRAICRQPNFPCFRVFYDLRRVDESVHTRFARARESGYDALAEEALAIADTPQKGLRTLVKREGVEYIEEDMIQHRKLQIETRLKLLAKWDPARYGEKLEVKGDLQFVSLDKLAKEIAAEPEDE